MESKPSLNSSFCHTGNCLRLAFEERRSILDKKNSMCLCLLGSVAPFVPKKKSSWRCRSRQQRSAQNNDRRQVEYSMLQALFEEQAKYRAQIEQQQIEINQLKEQLQQLQKLPEKLYDGLDRFACGFGAVQNRLGEFHQKRPGGGLRYNGL